MIRSEIRNKNNNALVTLRTTASKLEGYWCLHGRASTGLKTDGKELIISESNIKHVNYTNRQACLAKNEAMIARKTRA